MSADSCGGKQKRNDLFLPVVITGSPLNSFRMNKPDQTMHTKLCQQPDPDGGPRHQLWQGVKSGNAGKQHPNTNDCFWVAMGPIAKTPPKLQ